MQTIKKVSIGDFEKVWKATQRTIPVHWLGVAMEITPTLSLTSMLEFVNSVVESCFTDGGDYVPEVKDFAIRRNTLERYGNFRMPVDVHKCYDLVYGTEAYDFVLEYANRAQLGAIEAAIDEKIQFKLDSMIDAMRSQLEEFVSGMNDLQEQTKHMFDGLTEEDMQKLSAAMADGGLDEQKLVAAYLAQTHEEQANTEG